MSAGPSTVIITLPGCTSPWHTTTSSNSPPVGVPLDRRDQTGAGLRRRCRRRPRRSARRSPTRRTTPASRADRHGGSRSGSSSCTDPDHRSRPRCQSIGSPDGTIRSQQVTDSSPDDDRIETAGLGDPQTLIGEERGQLDGGLGWRRRRAHPQHQFAGRVGGRGRSRSSRPAAASAREPPEAAPPRPPRASAAARSVIGRSTNGSGQSLECSDGQRGRWRSLRRITMTRPLSTGTPSTKTWSPGAT